MCCVLRCTLLMSVRPHLRCGVCAMGDDKWIRRKPGRVSGTVVPPPAGGHLPPLPQRRGLTRPRLGRDGLGQARSRSVAPDRPERPDNSKYTKNSKRHEGRESSEGSEHLALADNAPSPAAGQNAEFRPNSTTSQNPESPAGPALPDNVRQLFPPVLHARKIQPATARNLHPSAGQVKRADLSAVTDRQPGTDRHFATDRRPGTGARSSTDGRSGTGRRPASDGASPASTLASPNGQAVTASLPLAVAWGAPQRPRAGRLTWSRRRPTLISQRMVATPGGRRQMVWMVALTVLVLLTAAGTMAALMRQPSTGRGDRAGNQGNVPGGRGAADARAAAARWVSREVSRSDIIGCDAVMCTALVGA